MRHRFSYPRDASAKRAPLWRARAYAIRVPSTPRTEPTAGEATDAGAWRERLVERMAAHRVPGATLGIVHEGRVTVIGAGVLSKATGVEVTPESLFQIGSITKVWTATLVLQLVDEGRLDLDAPVADVLPGFRVADPDVTRRVTTRHLLTHTSGIDGDVFTDTGRGDDCIARYVDGLADVGQNRYEEVNVVDARTPGLNYGWNIMEGAHCYPGGSCDMSGLVLPALEYTHDDGCSVTGGLVYRGAAIPSLVGHYLYADYCAGWIRSFRYDGTAATDQRELVAGGAGNILSFGQDAAGEVYVLSSNGRVYRIEPAE